MKKATFDTNTIKDTVVLSDTQFFQMFRTYEKSAWRLELLPNYMMKVDTNYHDYLSGKILPGNLNKEWWLCNENWGGVIKENLINNRTMARVRLVPEAVTSYFRYEVEWGYCYNALYGDDIRFLEQEKLTPKYEIYYKKIFGYLTTIRLLFVITTKMANGNRVA